MSLRSDVVRILTLDCRTSSQLVSESLDRPLRRAERIALVLHTIGCWSCRRLGKQVRFIHEAAGRFERGPARNTPGDDKMSAPSTEAKDRIKAALRSAKDEP